MSCVFHITSHDVMIHFSCNTSVISYMATDMNGKASPGIIDSLESFIALFFNVK